VSCTCIKCLKKSDLYGRIMAVCVECGYKRCPGSYRHDWACSHSNDPNNPENIRAFVRTMRDGGVELLREKVEDYGV